MDREIEKLLKLSNIPGFVLMENEQKKLDAWKEAQRTIKVKKPRKVRKKTVNIVKTVDKEQGQIEEV